MAAQTRLTREQLKKENQRLARKNRQLKRRLADQRDVFYARNRLNRRIADNAPDMIWAKDMANRYLFVNRALCAQLLMCRRPETAIGKTALFFAERERASGQRHTFGEVCKDSDEMVKANQKTMRFVEEGLVRGNYLVLDVHKAPLLDENGTMVGTVGCGRDITGQREILKDLENKSRELEDRTESLSEANTALKVLLKKRDTDRKILEEKVLYNVKSLVRPYLKKIKNTDLSTTQSACIDILESNLNEIVSPLSRKLSLEYMGFTPTEVKVAGLVKQGRKAREIALLLGISTRTVEGYRYAIRDRLGIKGKKINLQTYLMTLR
jgi:PAS domain S-box-containing protein